MATKDDPTLHPEICMEGGGTFVKWGRVRSEKPKGMRLPSTFCCPTHAIICEILMKDPCTDHTFTSATVQPLLNVAATE